MYISLIELIILLQDLGGDPVSAEVVSDTGDKISTSIGDNNDGTYLVHFTPNRNNVIII